MIAIINMGPTEDGPEDERYYDLMINNEKITTFKHRRSKGLAICLFKAGMSVLSLEPVKHGSHQ